MKDRHFEVTVSSVLLTLSLMGLIASVALRVHNEGNPENAAVCDIVVFVALVITGLLTWLWAVCLKDYADQKPQPIRPPVLSVRQREELAWRRAKQRERLIVETAIRKIDELAEREDLPRGTPYTKRLNRSETYSYPPS